MRKSLPVRTISMDFFLWEILLKTLSPYFSLSWSWVRLEVNKVVLSLLSLSMQ